MDNTYLRLYLLLSSPSGQFYVFLTNNRTISYGKVEYFMRKIVNPPPLHFSLFDDNCLWPIHKLSDFICSVWWKMFTPNLKSTSFHLLPLFRRDKKFFLNIPWPISTEKGKNILDIQVGRSFLISGRWMQCKQEAIIGQGNPGNQLHPQLYLCIWGYISYLQNWM